MPGVGPGAAAREAQARVAVMPDMASAERAACKWLMEDMGQRSQQNSAERHCRRWAQCRSCALLTGRPCLHAGAPATLWRPHWRGR